MILHILNYSILFLSILIISTRIIIILISSSLFLKKSKNAITCIDSISVSVIVPIHCKEKSITENLQLLLEVNRSLEKEVIVVINGREYSKNISKELTALSNKNNNLKVFYIEKTNKACALDKGIREAHGDIVVLTDIDTRWEEGKIKKMISHFKDPSIEGVAGQVIPIPTKRLLNNCQIIEHLGFYVDRLASSLWKGATVPGPVGAFRKRVFNNAAFFDLETEGEDFYNSLNILEEGYGIICEPEALLFTQGIPDSIKNLVKQHNRWYMGIGEVFRRHFKKIFFKKISFKNKLKTFWHLFNLQLFYYLIAISELWFLTYSIFSRDFTSFLIWKCALFLNLMFYFTYSKSLLKKKIPSLSVPSILFFVTVYFYFLIILRAFSQIANLFGYKFQWSRDYVFTKS